MYHAKILSPKLEPHTPVLGTLAEIFVPVSRRSGHVTQERMDCLTSDEVLLSWTKISLRLILGSIALCMDSKQAKI